MTDPWNPWLPPVPAVPRRRNTDVVVLACAITAMLAAGMVLLGWRAVDDAAERDRRQEELADKAFEDALTRVPDTATVSPGPDGTKRFQSRAPDGDRHAFSLALPRGWDGRYVGVDENQYVFSDSVVQGPAGALTIDRIDLSPVGGFEQEKTRRDFVDGVKENGQERDLTITSASWIPSTIGDGEDAFHVDGTFRRDTGLLFNVRVVDSWRWG